MELLLTLASNSCIKFYDFNSTLLTHLICQNWSSWCLYEIGIQCTSFVCIFLQCVLYVYLCLKNLSMQRLHVFFWSMQYASLVSWKKMYFHGKWMATGKLNFSTQFFSAVNILGLPSYFFMLVVDSVA